MVSVGLTFPRILVNGTRTPSAVLDVGRSVAGPAVYAAGGFLVDLSASYAEIFAVFPAGSDDGRLYEVDATDFATGKFRLVAKNPRAAVTPTGTNAAPVASGLCVPATCNNNHPGLAAVAWTGNSIAAAAAEEVANGVDLSGTTVRYGVVARAA